MACEPLRAQDATLLAAQDPEAPLQIGAVALFEAGPLLDEAGVFRVGALAEHLDHRLAALPRFRQRLSNEAPPGMPPMWIDDPGFDVHDHVRHLALPHPNDEATLRELVAHLLETPLDPSRPLWQVWIVEGLDGDRIAVVPIVSHVMADGMALLELALTILDGEPEPAATPRHGPDADRRRDPLPPAGARPTLAELWTGLARTRLADGADALRSIAKASRRPLHLLSEAAGLVRAGVENLALAPALPITRPVGTHRDLAWARLPLPELKAIGKAEQAPLNDVVLAVVGGGLRAHLGTAGVDVDAIRPRVLVPVSTHATAGDGTTENRFSLMLAGLPTGIDEPRACLRAVHREMEQHKRSSQTSFGSLLFHASDIVPAPLLRAVGPAVLRHQPFVNLAVTNLPGTADPLYLLGARMLEAFPIVSVTGNIAVIIAVLSYEATLCVGVTVDADVVPDLDHLVDAIEASARALLSTAHDPAYGGAPRT